MEILTSVKRLYIRFKSLVNDFVYSFGRAALLLLVEVEKHTVPVRGRRRIRVKEGTANATFWFQRKFRLYWSAIRNICTKIFKTVITAVRCIAVICRGSQKLFHLKPHKCAGVQNCRRQTVLRKYGFVTGSVKHCVEVESIDCQLILQMRFR